MSRGVDVSRSVDVSRGVDVSRSVEPPRSVGAPDTRLMTFRGEGSAGRYASDGSGMKLDRGTAFMRQ